MEPFAISLALPPPAAVTTPSCEAGLSSTMLVHTGHCEVLSFTAC